MKNQNFNITFDAFQGTVMSITLADDPYNMYPHTCNGTDGEFYDVWANDQDFALYFAMMDGIFE